jgi:hypothetical protein
LQHDIVRAGEGQPYWQPYSPSESRQQPESDGQPQQWNNHEVCQQRDGCDLLEVPGDEGTRAQMRRQGHTGRRHDPAAAETILIDPPTRQALPQGPVQSDDGKCCTKGQLEGQRQQACR